MTTSWQVRMASPMALLRRRIESAKSAVDWGLMVLVKWYRRFPPDTLWVEEILYEGRDVVYIMIGRVSTIQGGLGFLPPTVLFFWDKANS